MIYRLGTYIPIPGIDPIVRSCQDVFEQQARRPDRWACSTSSPAARSAA